MKSKNKKDWFKLKRYPHIGRPFHHRDRSKWLEGYIKDPARIQNHAFLPLIHKISKSRKFRKTYCKKTGKLLSTEVDGKEVYRSAGDPKAREIFYAGHLDSLVFGYYSHKLTAAYESKLKANGLDQVVTAYRSIPVKEGDLAGPNKCNIDFANDVFKFIHDYPEDKFVAITFDITSFFDHLDHKILRDNWMSVLNKEKLPPDHFNIYKNITRFSYVDLIDIFKEFQNRIITQSRDSSGKLLPEKRKRISKIKYLKNQDAIAFCTKQEFIKVKSRLVRNRKYVPGKEKEKEVRNYGIPQGSPISSVLANIYMQDFDKAINDHVSDLNGIYRRYSDDMVVVCPLEQKESVIDLFQRKIKEFKLTIKDSKTQVFHFKRENEVLTCGQEFEELINWNKNFIYLGFEFDGETVLLKSGSLSNYYRKMKRTVKRAKHHASRKTNPNKDEIFKRRILKKLSYKGAKRRRKYLWDEEVQGFKKSEHYDWGNFISYSTKAGEIMMNNRIKAQTKRHWNKLNVLLKRP